MLASTEAIRKIKRYRLDYLFDPGPNWPKQYADERCWQQVGCDKLLERIRMNPFADPENIVEEYILQMAEFQDKHEENYDMFRTMKEVGVSVKELLNDGE